MNSTTNKNALITGASSGTGVHVTATCPGLTYLELHDVEGTREQVSTLSRHVWMGAQE